MMLYHENVGEVPGGTTHAPCIADYYQRAVIQASDLERNRFP